MVNRILVGGFAAALAGAAMLAISSAPASAFTLTSPSLEQPMASSNIDHVWWRHYGGWGHPWGWGGPHRYWGGGPGWAPGYWGGRACPWGQHLGPYGHYCWPN